MAAELLADGKVRSWASILDDVTRLQAEATSRLPILAGPVALMPDAHWGMGATIGSVLVTDDAVIPAAVGVDIGCGMAARRLALPADQLDVETLRAWQAQMRLLVPAGLGKWHDEPGSDTGQWMELNPPSNRLENRGRAADQLGTLGSGNHFVELAVDEVGSVWILLHSGSRGAGNKLAQIHTAIADELTGALAAHATGTKDGRDLAWLTKDTKEFDAYLVDLDWSQRYALENRRQLLSGAHRALNIALDLPIAVTDEVNCHHNYAVREYVVDLGRTAYVTRKGAIRAGVTDRGLIPGAMGQASFVVRGRNNQAAYASCSHGAGRLMSRGRARREIDLADFEARMEGVVWQDRSAEALLDEAPQSYKDIETVMHDQRDLVQIEHTLRAVANFKGVEGKRRKR